MMGVLPIGFRAKMYETFAEDAMQHSTEGSEDTNGHSKTSKDIESAPLALLFLFF